MYFHLFPDELLNTMNQRDVSLRRLRKAGLTVRILAAVILAKIIWKGKFLTHIYIWTVVLFIHLICYSVSFSVLDVSAIKISAFCRILWNEMTLVHNICK